MLELWAIKFGQQLFQIPRFVKILSPTETNFTVQWDIIVIHDKSIAILNSNLLEGRQCLMERLFIVLRDAVGFLKGIRNI